MAEPSAQGGPLAGLRVIELALAGQGPVCGALLAFLGAEVIKLEPESGDRSRPNDAMRGTSSVLGPPAGHLWQACNSNKESAVVDLRREADRARFRELIAGADAFISNMLTKTLEAYGADRDSVLAINQNIVYGHTGGLGFDGPLADDPCQDTVGMAYGGMMATCAERTGEPSYPQYGMSDVLSGTMLAFGVVTSLLSRARLGVAPAVTGSQLQSLMWMQMFNISAYASYGVRFADHDRTRPRIPLYNAYQASDGGWIGLGVLGPQGWETLMPMLGLQSLVDDPRFATQEGRAAHGEEIAAVIAAVFRTRTRVEWLAEMRAAKLMVGRVNRIEDLPTDEQVQANHLIVEIENGFKTVAMPFSIAGHEVPRRSPPELGSWDKKQAGVASV